MKDCNVALRSLYYGTSILVFVKSNFIYMVLVYMFQKIPSPFLPLMHDTFFFLPPLLAVYWKFQETGRIPRKFIILRRGIEIKFVQSSPRKSLAGRTIERHVGPLPESVLSVYIRKLGRRRGGRGNVRIENFRFADGGIRQKSRKLLVFGIAL